MNSDPTPSYPTEPIDSPSNKQSDDDTSETESDDNMSEAESDDDHDRYEYVVLSVSVNRVTHT